jgi:hypothetical protein
VAALPALLDRDLARKDIEDQAPELLATVREIVDEGTQLFGRLLSEAGRVKPPRPYHTAMLLLFRHVLELLDSADEQFRAGIFTPASLQARAILEAHMQLLYLQGARTAFRPSNLDAGDVDPVPHDAKGVALLGKAFDDALDQRGLAYIAGEYRRLAAHAESLDAAAIQQWFADNAGGTVIPPKVLDPAIQSGLQAEAAKFRGYLATPEFLPIDAEYTAKRGKRRHDPAWYALFGGAPTVKQLAASVGLTAPYDLFYGDSSEVMHGTNIGGQLGALLPGGGTGAARLRNFEMAAPVARRVLLDAMEIYRMLILALRPSDIALWNQWTPRWSAVAAAIR